MQPLRLELQAFGPYVEKQVIDFTDLQGQHVFLIQGETGSGKTMLLDAITYALYGKSSGGQREALESMRSFFAEDELDTYVSFTFSLHNKIYRFYRSVCIKYKRNKEKTYKVSVDAGEMIDGEYYPFFENPKQKLLEEKAEELMKLTYEQFVQVILLPQGKFERFLTSKSEDKQEILKTLFQMERWEKICTWMKEEVKKDKQKLEAYQQQKQVYLQTVNKTSIDEFYETLQAQKETLDVLTQEIIEASKCMSEVEEELFIQQKVHEWHQQLEQAKSKEIVLKNQYSDIQKDEIEVAFGQKQQQILPIYQQYQEAQKQYTYRIKEHEHANKHYEEAQQQIKQEDTILNIIKETQETLYHEQKNYDMYHRKKEALEKIVEWKKTLHHYQTLAKERQQELLNHQQQLDTFIKKQQQIEDETQQVVQTIKEHEQVEQRWQQYVQAYPHWEAIKCYVKQYEQFQIDIQGIEVLDQQQQQAFIQLQQEHDIMYQQVLDSSIMQLVSTLEDQKPCPVCGSLEHPVPAQLQEVFVDMTALKKKKQEVDSMKTAYEHTLRNKEIIKEKIKECQMQIHKEEKVILQLLQQEFKEEEYHDILKAYEALQASKQLYQTLLQKQQELQKQMQIKHQKQESLQEALRLYEQQIHTYTISLQKEQEIGIDDAITLEQLEKEMQQTQVYMQSLQQNIQKHQKKVEFLHIQTQTAKQKLQIAQDELEFAKKRYELMHTQLQEAYQTNNLTKEDMHTIIDLERLQYKRQKIQTYYETKAIVESMIQEATNHIKETSIKNVKALQETYQTQKQYVKELEQRHAKLSQQYEQAFKIKQQLLSLQEKIHQLEPKVLKKDNFVKAMRGDNSIGIERYVLGVLLSMITSSANQLLRKIHGGRYQLFRSDEAVGKTRKVGLELSVYDQYTLSKRSVVSLSGGEKFLVSLALSFAMLHVMQSQNGGVQLDMMFVDEGFGSLDEKSISDALSILQSMTKHKGMVGIISHVELLKENILYGIEVIKTDKGSKIQMKTT